MKPYTLKSLEEGKDAVTRTGLEVTGLTLDGEDDDYPIGGYIGHESYHWNTEGKWYEDIDSPYDIFEK